jgi:hypothetical protein
MKKLSYLFLIAILFNFGCAAPVKVVTTTDPNTKEVTVTETPMEQTGWTESGNLRNYYSFMSNAYTKCENIVSTMVDGILSTTDGVEYTKTEAVLMSVIQTQQIGNIKCDIPKIAPPKTMVDFADGNIVSLANFGLNVVNSINNYKKSDGKSIEIANTGGGSVFFNSSNNQLQNFSNVEGVTTTTTEEDVKTDNSVDSSTDNSEESHGLSF